MALDQTHTETKWRQHCKTSTTVNITRSQMKRMTEKPLEEIWRGKCGQRLQVDLEEDGDNSTRQSWVEMNGLWPIRHKLISQSSQVILQGLLYATSSKISDKSDNWQPSSSDFTTFPFVAPLQQRFSELRENHRSHPHPVGTPSGWYPIIGPWLVFFQFPKVIILKWPSSEWCRNWGQNFGPLPLIKMGRGGGNFCWFLRSTSRAPTYSLKTMGVPPGAKKEIKKEIKHTSKI